VNTNKAELETIGARAIDDQTLEITLEHPAPYFFQALSHYAFYPVPKHVVEKHGTKWIDKENMVTNGAYTLVDRVDNGYVHVKKNPYFYEAAETQIDEVFYYPAAGDTAVRRFRAGEFDINNDFPLPQLDWLKKNLPAETFVSPFILTQYVAFNTTRKPFDNRDVRLALGMAIDRETITNKVLNGGQVPAYGLVPPGISGYAGTAVVPYKDIPIEERRQKARELLSGAGFGPENPLRTSFIFQSTSPEAKRVAVALQNMWREVGVEVELQQSESKVHYPRLRRQDYDIGWGGWIADFNDARNYLFLAETRSEDMNYTKYSSAEFDRLMMESDATLDSEKRQQLMLQAEQMMLNEGPMAPVYFGTSRNLVHTWVKGWEANPLDVHRTRWMRIEGQRQSVAVTDEPGATAADGTQVQVEGERSWAQWFCSSFGLWCST
jgi:oligopeptide transport system substrate-binding protein